MSIRAPAITPFRMPLCSTPSMLVASIHPLRPRVPRGLRALTASARSVEFAFTGWPVSSIPTNHYQRTLGRATLSKPQSDDYATHCLLPIDRTWVDLVA
jgi:hypothetical protein